MYPPPRQSTYIFDPATHRQSSYRGKERNLSTRNQKVMNKELFIIIKQFMMPERQS